ncbi:hypothetical protein ACP3WV_22860, partial [Salmonella enterica]|uniref:hypothetical protein n=1 Tax=Salmonella enterica TaxID=28901 RepID=UPI003CED84AB
MDWENETGSRRVPHCISIETAALLRKQAVRKRPGTGRKALSLAAVHEPPDRLVLLSESVEKISLNHHKQSSFPFGAP